LRATTEIPQQHLQHALVVTRTPDASRADITINSADLAKIPARPVHKLGDNGIVNESAVILETSIYDGT